MLLVFGASAYARCGKEDAVAVAAGEPASLDAVEGSPLKGAVSDEFPELVERGYLPCAAPCHIGRIIFGTSDALADVTTGLLVTITAGVGFPFISLLHCRLASGVEVSIFLGLGGPHIAGGPHGARWKSQVDGSRMADGREDVVCFVHGYHHLASSGMMFLNCPKMGCER